MPTTPDLDTYWSELYDSGRDFTLTTSETLTKILSFTDPSLPKTCLDIGCGTGQLTRELYHRDYQCVGVDAATSAIKIAKSLTVAPREQLNYVRLDVEQGELSELPSQSYSFITCKLVFAFIKNKPDFLMKVKELLSPGGIFVVITPHIDDVLKERRGIAIDDAELALLSANFNQLSVYKGHELNSPLIYFIGAHD